MKKKNTSSLFLKGKKSIGFKPKKKTKKSIEIKHKKKLKNTKNC